ncbi:MAG TPA: hypothetical protein VGF98_04150 [Candidatus Tumulicola sp.]|jgi:hypothetical protein
MSCSLLPKATKRTLALCAVCFAVLVPASARSAIAGATTSNPTLTPASILQRALARLATYPTPQYAIYTTFWDIRTNQPDLPSSQLEWRYAVRQSDNAENATCRVDQTWLPQAQVEKDTFPLLASSILSAPSLTTAVDNYRVELTADSAGGASQPYHLRFIPIAQASTNNVRDLWIDRRTFDVQGVRYVAKGNGTTVTAQFGSASNYRTATHLRWISTGVNGNRSYDVTLVRTAFPQTLPAWLFDQSAYDQKQRAGTNDVLNVTLAQVGEDVADAPRTPHANAAFTRYTDRTTVVRFPVCNLAN